MKKANRYFLFLFVLINFVQIHSKEVDFSAEDYSQVSTNQLDDAFILAVEKNDVEKMQELIQAGADVNAPIRYLLTHGDCDWTIETTAFIYAATNDYPDMINVLLKFKNRINETVDEAFYIASMEGSSGVIKELIKEGVDVNHVNENGDTPLIAAVGHGRIDVTEILLNSGANVNYVNENGDTPLITAVGHGRIGVTKILLNYDVNVNHVNKNGDTPFIIAVRNGYQKNINTLLNSGANVNHVNKHGRTALMEAVINHDLNTVKNILQAPGIYNGSFFGFGTKPVNYADEDGNTALILAIKNIKYTYLSGDESGYKVVINSQNILEDLLQNPHIDPYHVNNFGETASSLLEELNNKLNNYPQY